MTTSTQASQLRLSQRPGDSGWVAPVCELAHWNGTTWVAATSQYDPKGVVLSLTGNVAFFKAVFVRNTDLPVGQQALVRLSFPDREDTVSTAQVAGTLAIRTPFDTPINFNWGLYDLVITPDGVLAPLSPELEVWDQPEVGSVVQFTASWFIEE